MNRETQLKLFKTYCSTQKIPVEIKEKMETILVSKSKDYSKKTDVLSSFKEAAAYSKGKMSAIDIVDALICVKLARIDNLKGRDALYESLEDSEIDLLNYDFLKYCLIEERNEGYFNC